MGALLIVDDGVELANLMAATFTELGFKVFVVHNAKDGLAKLSQETIDCIISDINMPNMNGLEFIKKVRENKWEMPFIFYTGYGSEDALLEASKYGCFEFLEKPEFSGVEDAVKRGMEIGKKRRTNKNYDKMQSENLQDLIKKMTDEK
jgi:DNA-binding NtrC family response regulator